MTTDGCLSKRADQHAAMLKAALEHPGMREMLESYGAWRRVEQVLEAYRAATATTPTVTTTDRANAPTRR